MLEWDMSKSRYFILSYLFNTLSCKMGRGEGTKTIEKGKFVH
jgi:hypothetical protein